MRGYKGREICIHMTDSCCCTAEMNTTLQNDYIQLKNKLKKEYRKFEQHYQQSNSRRHISFQVHTEHSPDRLYNVHIFIHLQCLNIYYLKEMDE